MSTSHTNKSGSLHRLFRHLWAGDREVRKAFPEAVLQRVEQHVVASETGHSGELRVVIEGGLGWDAFKLPSSAQSGASPALPSLSRARAITLFAELGVWDTADNSGVLIYILMAEHQIEIIADRGIHTKVGEGAWQEIVVATTARFRQGEYEQGLLAAIESISALLHQHFPAGSSNPNELSDRPLVL